MNEKELQAKLAAPFSADDVEWRVQRVVVTKIGAKKAVVVAYLQSRAIQQRLDEVMGPFNWKTEYHEMADGFLCGLSLRYNEQWITKWDGAPKSDFESIKGGLSNAFKRSAVPWGVGRYLYDLPEVWVDIVENRSSTSIYVKQKTKVNGNEEYVSGFWEKPTLPNWALPEAERMNNKASKSPATSSSSSVSSQSAPQQKVDNQTDSKMVRTLKRMESALEMKEEHRKGLFKKVNQRMVNNVNDIYVAQEEELQRYYYMIQWPAMIRHVADEAGIGFDLVARWLQEEHGVQVSEPKSYLSLITLVLDDELDTVKRKIAEMKGKAQSA